MAKKVKNVLGLKMTGPERVVDNEGKSRITPGVTAWALVKITEPEVIAAGREQVGAYLKGIRESKELSYYAVGKAAGLSIEQVQNIEAGGKAYTIDSFLRICRALDCYFFLESRDGNHLDSEHMMKKAKKE